MESACGTPKYTTYTVGFKDCLDYIYYQTDNISVTSVVPFPLEEEMEKVFKIVLLILRYITDDSNIK